MKFKYIFIILFITSCKTNVEYTKDIPEWSKNSVMYEVNIRQFSPEGTFNAFSEHLPRIKEMGVDIFKIVSMFVSWNKVSVDHLTKSLINNKKYLDKGLRLLEKGDCFFPDQAVYLNLPFPN